MVSWSKAFKQAILILIFTVIWCIIGGIIIVIGTLMIGGGAIEIFRSIMVGEYPPPTEPTMMPSMLASTTVIGGLIITFIGVLVTVLGYTATFIKYLTETIIDEVRSLPTTPSPPPQPYTPPYTPPPSQILPSEQQT